MGIVVNDPPEIFINAIGPRAGRLSIETERIDVRTFGEKRIPDPKWNHTDRNGHFHAWNIAPNETPRIFTAEEKFEVRTNPHRGIGEYCVSLGYFCVICNDSIPNPGMRPDPNPVDSIPGRTTWTVEFENQEGFPGLSGILNRGDSCTVRIPRIHAFGIAQCMKFTWTSEGWHFTLIGTSPLGLYGGK